MWDDARQLDAIAKGLAVIAVALLLWGTVSWAARQAPFAFREVVVRGALAHVDAANLETVVRRELSGTFFTMNLEARLAPSKLPWVRNIALRAWRSSSRNGRRHVPLADGTTARSSTPSATYSLRTRSVAAVRGPGRAAGSRAVSRIDGGARAAQPHRRTVRSRGGCNPAKGISQLAIELGREEPAATRASSAYERTIGIGSPEDTHRAWICGIATVCSARPGFRSLREEEDEWKRW
jgi:cell division protein FtsQ